MQRYARLAERPFGFMKAVPRNRSPRKSGPRAIASTPDGNLKIENCKWQNHRVQALFFHSQFSIFLGSVVTAEGEVPPPRPLSWPLTHMPKNQIEPTTEVSSGFFERRRLRRIRMIV